MLGIDFGSISAVMAIFTMDEVEGIEASMRKNDNTDRWQVTIKSTIGDWDRMDLNGKYEFVFDQVFARFLYFLQHEFPTDAMPWQWNDWTIAQKSDWAYYYLMGFNGGIPPWYLSDVAVAPYNANGQRIYSPAA